MKNMFFFVGDDTGIQFKPNKHDLSHQVDPHHENDDGPYRTVNLIIIDQVIDCIKKYDGQKNDQKGSYNCTGINET
jgi:hypothetical protein